MVASGVHRGTEHEYTGLLLKALSGSLDSGAQAWQKVNYVAASQGEKNHKIQNNISNYGLNEVLIKTARTSVDCTIARTNLKTNIKLH